MTINVLMPRLGETVVEGTVSRWLVAEGEPVQKLAPLLEISTDKIDTEIPSPADGILLRILIAAGATVAAGALIAVIGQPDEKWAESITPPDDAPAGVEIARPRTLSGVGGAVSTSDSPGFISPVVARLAAEHNVDLGQVRGTGLKGRIRKQDVLSYLDSQAAESSPARASSSGINAEAAPGAGDFVPLTRLRRLVAEHMVQSVATSPHVTTVFDCDLAAVVKHRYANRDEFARAGIDLTFTPYFVAAVVIGLRQHPYANASWSDGANGPGLLLHRAIHVGIAVALPDGLVVPVIRDADSYNLLGLARSVGDLARRARAGQLQPDEIQGGTFTLTNHGTSGSLFATPIINQPQTGILGVGRIHKQPVVISRGHPLLPDAEDTIAIRPVAYLSFTFDHRILDGAAADAFVTTVKAALEHWQN